MFVLCSEKNDLKRRLIAESLLSFRKFGVAGANSMPCDLTETWKRAVSAHAEWKYGQNTHNTPSSLSSSLLHSRRGQIHRRRITSSDSISPHFGSRAMVVVTNLVQPSCKDNRDDAVTQSTEWQIIRTVRGLMDCNGMHATSWWCDRNRSCDVWQSCSVTCGGGRFTSLACNCSISLSDAKFTRILSSSACKVSVLSLQHTEGWEVQVLYLFLYWWTARSSRKPLQKKPGQCYPVGWGLHTVQEHETLRQCPPIAKIFVAYRRQNGRRIQSSARKSRFS